MVSLEMYHDASIGRRSALAVCRIFLPLGEQKKRVAQSSGDLNMVVEGFLEASHQDYHPKQWLPDMNFMKWLHQNNVW